jgi:HAD superfamily hydrolase (TIGR01484 family)
MKKLVAFDLDGTLAESKQPIGDDMADLLAELLSVVAVAVISGGDWPQFDKQVVSRLPSGANIARLYIMPATGTKLYCRGENGWEPVYADVFSPAERDRIIAAIENALDQAGLRESRIWGERIEDRGSQITFSGLGQKAPLADKKNWDPDFSKRSELQRLLRRALPELAINVGGSTSVDITRSGVDKAYGMSRLIERTGYRSDEILFFGDAMYDGGNDYPVRAHGIDSIAVAGVAETQNLIRAIIACLRP